jgi:hypothetical protein
VRSAQVTNAMPDAGEFFLPGGPGGLADQGPRELCPVPFNEVLQLRVIQVRERVLGVVLVM